MKISTFRFLTGRGIRNLGTHWAMTTACIGSLVVCLILNGFAQLIEINVESAVQYLGTQNETVVYLDPDCDGETSQKAGEALASIPGVIGISYVSKSDVLAIYRNYMSEYASLWDAFDEDNPFKANFRVSVGDLTRLPEMVEQMRVIPGVVKVTSPTELTEVFVTVQGGVTKAARGFVAILMVVSIITVYSTIRLSVYARRQEVEIMKYVGATDSMVGLPFFVEGLLIGLLSGAIGAGVVLLLYRSIVGASVNLSGVWAVLFSSTLVPMEAVWQKMLSSCLLSGAVIGGLGSLLSIRRHLRV